jgi:hypothetical protein
MDCRKIRIDRESNLALLALAAATLWHAELLKLIAEAWRFFTPSLRD